MVKLNFYGDAPHIEDLQNAMTFLLREYAFKAEGVFDVRHKSCWSDIEIVPATSESKIEKICRTKSGPNLVLLSQNSFEVSFCEGDEVMPDDSGKCRIILNPLRDREYRFDIYKQKPKNP